MNTDIKFDNLIQLTQYFSDEAKCVKHLEQLRWGGTIACVHCGSTKVYKCKGLKAYKCGEKECLKRFSVITGTFFENTKIPLSKWFIAMYLCFSHKKGVSSHQLGRDLGISQKSAWFVLHRVRSLVNTKAPQMLYNKIAEADETYVGGKEGNKHLSKRKPIGEPDKHKAPGDNKAVIIGVVQRQGNVIAKHVTDRKKENIEPFIFENVEYGAKVITDEYYAYQHLEERYQHFTIKHSEKIYVEGFVHTNTIENFWSCLKRGIYGTYHKVSEKHIQKYVDEFSYKYNTRKESEQTRFDRTLEQCNGRLKWNELIEKKRVQ